MEEKIKQAENILTKHGVEAGEEYYVLQAIGYVLMDVELYPDEGDIDLSPYSSLDTVRKPQRVAEVIEILIENDVPEEEAASVAQELGYILLNEDLGLGENTYQEPEME